jgi:hypothetical protein
MTTRYRLILSVVATGFLASAAAQSPTPTPEGRVTSVFHDVQLLPEKAAARQAIIDDPVGEGTGLRTGDDSRSELTFTDLTITRLGANTIFSFSKAGRSVRLDGGTILLYARKNSGPADIVTKAVSVAITGTTVIVQSQPINFDRLIVLEGDARVSLNDYPKESTLVRGGQVLNINANARKIPKPGRIDLSRILSTNPLIKNFPPLPSLDLILAAMQNQNPNPSKPPVLGSGPIHGLPVYAPTPAAIPPGTTTLPGYPTPNPIARPSPHRPAPTPKPTPKAAPTPKGAVPTPKPTGTPHRRKFPPKPTPTPKKQLPPLKKRYHPTPTPGQVIR